MSRPTVTPSEPRYIALKEASVQRGKTMGQWNEESLECDGIKSRTSAMELVRGARSHSELTDEQAMSFAQHHVRSVRNET